MAEDAPAHDDSRTGESATADTFHGEAVDPLLDPDVWLLSSDQASSEREG